MSHEGRGAAVAAQAPWTAAFKLLRPRQWVKNLLVVAAPGAAGALAHDDVPYRLLAAFAAFCLLSSGVYAVNDVRDVSEDRLHPRKRHRPIASGQISTLTGLRLGALLMGAGIALCYAVRPQLAGVGAAYLALMLSYTLLWRHVALLDVAVISLGFVLRAVAGGVAAEVVLSNWFVLVVSASAVFVAAAKRYSELHRAERGEAARRRVLDRYSPRLLQAMMGASAAMAIAAYSVWAFQTPLIGGFPWRPLTVLPFVLCLARYSMRVRAGTAEAPEDVLLGDRALLITGSVWLALFALGVNAAS